MDVLDELVDAFGNAAPFALREMAGVDAVVRDAHPAGAADAFGDVIASIRLAMNAGEGRMILSFPQQTAAQLARRILADATDAVPPDLLRDCIGEVANVIAGQAKSLLVGCPSHFTLSSPRTDGSDCDATADPRRVVQFESDIGPFAIHLRSPG